MNEQIQVDVFETGIGEPGEMNALRDVIQPTITVLTDLGGAYQEDFGLIEDKCHEKLIFFHDAETLTYPVDDEIISKIITEHNYPSERLY